MAQPRVRHRRDGRRVPDPRADRLGDLDRRRRRLDRPCRRSRHAEGRAGERRRQSRSRPATAAAARARPSPTPMRCAGFLGAGELGYGAVQLDLDAGASRRRATSPARLGLGLEQTAEAIIKVSISGMFLEVSKLFSRHGADPRDFALLPFGGAGPMTGCLLARDLGLERMIVPPTPGVLAAFGGLIADIRNDFIRTAFVELDRDGAGAPGEYAARARDGGAGVASRRAALSRGRRASPGRRTCAIAANPTRSRCRWNERWIDSGGINAIGAAFHREHARVYEYADEKAPVQVVNLRLVVIGAAPQPTSHGERRCAARGHGRGARRACSTTAVGTRPDLRSRGARGRRALPRPGDRAPGRLHDVHGRRLSCPGRRARQSDHHRGGMRPWRAQHGSTRSRWRS